MIILLLLVVALLFVVGAAMGKVPEWPAVLVLIIVELLHVGLK